MPECYVCGTMVARRSGVRVDYYSMLCDRCSGIYLGPEWRENRRRGLLFTNAPRDGWAKSRAMSEADNQGQGETGRRKKGFGRRAGGNFLQATHLERVGTMEVTVRAVKVIPRNEDLDIDERDGLEVELPNGEVRDFALNVGNSEKLLQSIPDAETTEGKSVVGHKLTLSYIPKAGTRNAGVAISRVD